MVFPNLKAGPQLLTHRSTPVHNHTLFKEQRSCISFGVDGIIYYYTPYVPIQESNLTFTCIQACTTFNVINA